MYAVVFVTHKYYYRDGDFKARRDNKRITEFVSLCDDENRMQFDIRSCVGQQMMYQQLNAYL